jgi:S-adenosylmethionine:diacylglycerol 3-amino-3-carboxypropyl transferase
MDIAVTDLIAALDVLDWLTDEQIAAMRSSLSRSLRGAARGSSSARPEVEWSPIQRALLFVLWSTSTEVLEAACSPLS